MEGINLLLYNVVIPLTTTLMIARPRFFDKTTFLEVHLTSKSRDGPLIR